MRSELQNKHEARRWALETLSYAPSDVDPVRAAIAEFILENTTPGLKPWDGVEMNGREWIVWSITDSGVLTLVSVNGGGYAHDFEENVVPNGKTYKLVEDNQKEGEQE